MTDPKKPPAPTAITEAGAVELNESELDNVSGGPIYMQVDGIKGNVRSSTPDITNNLSVKFEGIKIGL